MRHFFSIIVPVYNRKEEVEELLRSFQEQSYKNFEVVIVEDGSTIPCKEVVNLFEKNISIQYLYKENEGRSIARNKGMEMARGDYFVFLDSDCFAPKEYLQNLNENLSNHYVDCFGGKDMAHDSFSDLQKAINFSMTSFLTTGGIRGGKVRMEKFVPRSFNMGFSRETWEKVGGFREMFSEDIDISTRIHMKGCSISLLENVEVYHRRRTSLRKFAHQVYVFGMSRITLKMLYPDSLKLVHCLPAVFLLGCIGLLVLSVFWKKVAIIPLVFYLFLLFISALYSTKKIRIASLSILTSMIQLCGYGAGFIQAFTEHILLKHQRNTAKEKELRKGANE
ncbi:MAG TPA: glycosyl transferase family 2 [Porphyromonadaceae bacterium]|nr:glycosyl transferase family 2 [Porphyromonadaceae bacterium]